MLVWAGIESVFFITAGMGLFWSSVGNTGMLQLLRSAFKRVMDHSAPHPTSKGAGGAQGAGRGHSCDS